MMPEPGFQNPMLYFRSEQTEDQKELCINTCATDSYLRSGCSQKVVNFPIDVDGALKIGDTTNLSLNQVVAVDSGGDSGAIHPGRHELQDSHLDRGSCARGNRG